MFSLKEKQEIVGKVVTEGWTWQKRSKSRGLFHWWPDNNQLGLDQSVFRTKEDCERAYCEKHGGSWNLDKFPPHKVRITVEEIE